LAAQVVIQVKLLLGPAWSRLQGDREYLEAVRNDLMYRDKQAENDLTRFRRSCKFKEKYGNTGPVYQAEKSAKMSELMGKLDVYATKWKGDELLVPTGFAARLQPIADIVDARSTDQNQRSHRPSTLKPRKPQIEGLRAALSSRYNNGTLRIATGVGKTSLAVELIRKIGKRSLFLVPSKPILKQTVDRFTGAYGKDQVGWFYGDGKKHGYVTVATYQSVNAAEAGEFDEYHTLIGDEIHHVGADTFFDAAMEHIPNAVHRYGLTADEERADGGTILVEAACGPVIYDYPAWQAIEENFLAKPTFVTYDVPTTEGTYKLWKTRDKKRVCEGIVDSVAIEDGDDLESYKSWVLGNDRLAQFVAGMAKGLAADGQSSLILVDEVEHGEKICALLGEEFRDYGFAVGGGKNNETLQKAFNQRVLKILVATSTLGEGADTVPVDCLFNLMGGVRPKQAVGRALRNDPDEYGIAQKPTTLVVDFNYPNSEILSRHYEARSEVYLQYRCGLPVRMGPI
jgi:superfamily II DNA or RNA helicase